MVSKDCSSGVQKSKVQAPRYLIKKGGFSKMSEIITENIIPIGKAVSKAAIHK